MTKTSKALIQKRSGSRWMRLHNLTIAGNSEGCNVSAMKFDEDPDQYDIEDHALHQHPHEGDQEPVVEKNSN
jgi:hypothetical protein